MSKPKSSFLKFSQKFFQKLTPRTLFTLFWYPALHMWNLMLDFTPVELGFTIFENILLCLILIYEIVTKKSNFNTLLGETIKFFWNANKSISHYRKTHEKTYYVMPIFFLNSLTKPEKIKWEWKDTYIHIMREDKEIDREENKQKREITTKCWTSAC